MGVVGQDARKNYGFKGQVKVQQFTKQLLLISARKVKICILRTIDI